MSRSASTSSTERALHQRWVRLERACTHYRLTQALTYIPVAHLHGQVLRSRMGMTKEQPHVTRAATISTQSLPASAATPRAGTGAAARTSRDTQFVTPSPRTPVAILPPENRSRMGSIGGKDVVGRGASAAGRASQVMSLNQETPHPTPHTPHPTPDTPHPTP
jgi:hypothetical protein